MQQMMAGHGIRLHTLAHTFGHFIRPDAVYIN